MLTKSCKLLFNRCKDVNNRSVSWRFGPPWTCPSKDSDRGLTNMSSYSESVMTHFFRHSQTTTTIICLELVAFSFCFKPPSSYHQHHVVVMTTTPASGASGLCFKLSVALPTSVHLHGRDGHRPARCPCGRVPSSANMDLQVHYADAAAGAGAGARHQMMADSLQLSSYWYSINERLYFRVEQALLSWQQQWWRWWCWWRWWSWWSSSYVLRCF